MLFFFLFSLILAIRGAGKHKNCFTQITRLKI